jgi:hypothetical protein
VRVLSLRLAVSALTRAAGCGSSRGSTVTRGVRVLRGLPSARFRRPAAGEDVRASQPDEVADGV